MPLLRPDLPTADELLPWLRRIDAARRYTNFGPLATEFEAGLGACLAQAAQPCHVVALSSGTAPLELGLAALGLAPGARVLLPAYTFPATATALLRNGLEPVFADVDAHSWQLTPAIARARLAAAPCAAVLPVATFGCPLDAAAWDAFSADSGLPVLADAAAAFGNQRLGRHVHWAFSFHATKPFGIGEGGAFVSPDGELAARVRRLSNFGFADGLVQQAGSNAKLSEYAAAVGLAQLQRWPRRQARRAAVWADYAAGLAALPGLRLQQGYGAAALPAKLVVRTALPADVLQAALARHGIETRRWYCPPLYGHPAFARWRPAAPLARSEALGRHSLGLPWFPELAPAQAQRVVAALAACGAEG